MKRERASARVKRSKSQKVEDANASWVERAVPARFFNH